MAQQDRRVSGPFRFRNAARPVFLAGLAFSLAAGAAAQSAPPQLPAKNPAASPAPAAAPLPAPRLARLEPAVPPAASAAPAAPPPASFMDLTVPPGTPLHVALLEKVRIGNVGAPVTATVVEPVYSFDRVVIPAGSEVTGKVVEIVKASKLRRTEAIMNANFTPLRTAKVQFDTLILKDGTRMAIETQVSPGTQDVIRLIAKPEGTKKPGLVSQAKQAIDQEWRMAMAEVKKPGKLHRLRQYAVRELPYHREYLEQGTVYDARLLEPVECGKVQLQPQEMAHYGDPPPANSVVAARLLIPLSSATARVGAPVDAVITKPLFAANNQLLLPVGTELEGSVVQARPARRLHHNGLLRFVIRRMELPTGATMAVDASIEGLEVSRDAHVALDSEGGARVTTPKRRYLDTSLSLAVATTTVLGDSDHKMGSVESNGGDAGPRGLAGISGYRVIGLILGATVQSRAFSAVLGFYGAGWSVYRHFLASGQNIVLAKDTPILISFGAGHPTGH